MYAASEARGGVLEPNGAASIKFREPDYLAAAHRIDRTLQVGELHRNRRTYTLMLDNIIGSTLYCRV
jgi:acetyl-CoA carboxylase carboxyltransferase component